jgi:hypothetical protein
MLEQERTGPDRTRQDQTGKDSTHLGLVAALLPHVELLSQLLRLHLQPPQRRIPLQQLLGALLAVATRLVCFFLQLLGGLGEVGHSRAQLDDLVGPLLQLHAVLFQF